MEDKTLATSSNQITISQENIELIKKTVAKDATNEELQMFLYQAQRTGLDPLNRQIYFIKRAGKVTIQTSIDGFRVISERSGSYAGMDAPVFEEKDGKLIKCEVAIYKFSKSGERYKAAVGVAYWSEYCPPAGQDFMWRKMPHTMLSKVAEALARRIAFPQDLSGLYTKEEMDQAGGREVNDEGNKPIAPSQIRRLKDLMEEKSLKPEDLLKITEGKNAKDLTYSQMEELISKLEGISAKDEPKENLPWEGREIPEEKVPDLTPELIETKHMRRYYALLKKKGISTNDIRKEFGFNSVKDLTVASFEKVIAEVEKRPDIEEREEEEEEVVPLPF